MHDRIDIEHVSGPGLPIPVKVRDELLEAIREHRSSRTPSEWTRADRVLYAHLPEVRS